MGNRFLPTEIKHDNVFKRIIKKIVDFFFIYEEDEFASDSGRKADVSIVMFERHVAKELIDPQTMIEDSNETIFEKLENGDIENIKEDLREMSEFEQELKYDWQKPIENVVSVEDDIEEVEPEEKEVIEESEITEENIEEIIEEEPEEEVVEVPKNVKKFEVKIDKDAFNSEEGFSDEIGDNVTYDIDQALKNIQESINNLKKITIANNSNVQNEKYDEALKLNKELNNVKYNLNASNNIPYSSVAKSFEFNKDENLRSFNPTIIEE